MSSAGQPENDDLSRDHGCAPQMRHPAGGASQWRMPRHQRHVLAATAGELRADAELAALFSYFTSTTAGAAMPETERLPAWRPLAGWRRWLAFLSRRMVLAVAVVIPLAAVVAALALALSAPGGKQIRCAPSYASASGCTGSYGTPAGLEWQLQGSSVQPAHAVGRP
jgi:hypothetical protein